MRRFPLVVAVTAAALLLGGCSAGADDTSSDREPGDLTGLKIAFAIPTSAADVYVNQRDTFVDQAEELGATVEVFDNNGDAATTLSNADLMVAAEPDVIVEFSPVADATDRVGQKFQDAGIPCIALNVPVPGCNLLNFDQPYLADLGADVIAGEMSERGWTADDTTVVIGQASDLGESVNIAVTSFYESLSAQVPGMTPVKRDEIEPTTTKISDDQGLQLDLGVTLDQAYNELTTALQSIPEDRNLVIYTVSDDATFGAQRAIANAGRSGTTIMSGYGGGAEALNQIRESDTSGWVSDQMGFFSYWGEFALAMVAAVDMDLEIPELTAPPMVVLTADNVDEYFAPGTHDLLMMPELPEGSRYLIETGILQKYGNVTGATD